MRDYFLISVVLIGGGLITSGLVEIYYRYHENRDQLGLLQKEIAAGAAFKIEHFVQEIHNILKGATKSRDIAPKGLTADFRFELEKLLLIAPAVTEAVALNQNGVIQVQASRLRTVLPDAKKDLSTAAAFKEAQAGKSYFGKVYFVRGSEPYITIAVPIERFAGDVIGVLQAEVNLKYIGDVISSLTIGKAGYAYAVTQSGELIAHPDISLVLQRRNVRELAVVKTAFESVPGPPTRAALVASNIQGKEVLSAFALIPALDWAVIVDRPVEEAYEALYDSMLRTSALFMIGLGMALFASFFIARRVIQPVRILREGVERIGTGELGYRLNLKTGDEIEVLADEFNKMTSQLQESYANLEQKVEDRTRELTESLEQQTATSEILRVIAGSPTDVQPVLDVVAERAARLCEAEDAILFRVVGNHHQRVAKYGSIPAPEFPVPITRGFPGGRAIIDRQTIHIHDIEAVLDTEYLDVKTIQREIGQRTVLATPLLREGIAIGAIVIRRLQVRPFSEKQIALLKTFADQAVIAIENVRLFQEIQEKNDQLEAANKHKSQFLANVSHELRTPLNSIIGFTRLVLRKTEGQIEKLQKDNLQKVLISSEHLLNLINGLLDLAKIESGKMEAYVETFKLDEVVRVATTTVEPMLKDGRVKLVTEIAPDIPALKTDRDKLKQSVLNLLSNAVKFTEKGEIKVAAWSDNGNLKMTVSDTGIGMKKEALALIFEEFRQADMSSTRRYGGTGLGLAIVRRFINLMGGEIAVESELGKGSKFTITIPMELKQ
ncbi:MAG TPA: ATP-binding protein [Candidatus Limnocylindria bacterium]|nr:ATP-binding protein [Candidatus Limnocylindria bacterium]